MNISLTPPTLFNIGPIGITSGHTTFALVTIVLIVMGFFVGKNVSVVPGRLQIIMEMIVEWFHEKIKMSTPKKYQKLNLHITITIFLVVLFSNLFGFLPILSQITYDAVKPEFGSVFEGNFLFFTPTAHLSLPLALGIFIVGLGQLMALIIAPIRHIGNYIKPHLFLKVRSFGDLFNAGIEFFLGLMDIIGEIANVISVSNRLFGNMISGILMSAVIIGLSYYTQFIVPIPFYALGLLAAVIQAIVFALLSSLFLGSTLQAVMPKQK